MKLNSIWSCSARGVWQAFAAEYPLVKNKFVQPAMAAWRHRLVSQAGNKGMSTRIGLPRGKDVRKSGFATLLWYSMGEAEPTAASTVVAAATASVQTTTATTGSQNRKRFASNIFTAGGLKPSHLLRPSWAHTHAGLARAGYFSLRFNSTQTNGSGVKRPNNEEVHHETPDEKTATPAASKSDSTITITTPGSKDITLPATSARVSQRLKRHHAREELLARSSNMIGRMWLRVKWFLYRGARAPTMDDFSAVFSWFLVGNIIWILLGTTTFFSLVLFTMNTVFAQEYMAKIIGNLITKETGLMVVFENAIVPHWNDGVISFNKVFVSKRPGHGNHRVQKGSQAEAAAEAAMNANSKEFAARNDLEKISDNGNYTQFDLTIETVSVTLSLSKWVNGAGIVKDVEVKGLRGVVDRRHVKWNPGDDARNYLNIHQPGDFEIENFKLEDALFTLYHPNGFRPFRVSIFNCELPRLRKHWLFYDLLSANNMSGSYDNSLFTIHPKQLENVSNGTYDGPSKSPWKKVNRFRVDGVNIDHLNTGVEGPLGWIESGNVDILCDVMLPEDEEDLNLGQVVRDIKDSWKSSTSALSKSSKPINDEDDSNSNSSHLLRVPRAKTLSSQRNPKSLAPNKYVVLDFRVQLNNSRAAVPLFTKDLTYINNALIRPIVAYINSRETYIPINCQVVKNFSDFEGSWTMYDSRLMDDLSAGVYDAFAANIMDDEARALRIKKVGFWSIQLAAQLLLLSLGAIA